MTHLHDDDAALGERLRNERPVVTALELDGLKRRIMSRRNAGSGRTRIAVLAMLVFGFVFSGAGVGLAINGFADNDQAAVAQYGRGVLGEGESGGGAGDDGTVIPNSGTSDDNVQQTRQVQQAGGANQLPFTGFAAIPVLLLGTGLLTAGFLVRRRSTA
jgi:hypothetical protein